ncbi:helix-turn-helix domain-containing protein [Paenibacillus sp. KQZ6P-2]|uniref:Helix-turn-helix domain-containing protein n=1 Tax=Paenibacillus mangrovi TaxID=2931978 RepID=A0A9X2B4W6_9BACL|nr:helix-turn-helix domain-containing protein [Paenibacillus mangrovi]MCJ8015104.1 helix-turn-helix domain-containing protein [Paenibacillus mangrovi]
MVEMETLRNKLEQIIGTPLRIKQLTKQQSESVYNRAELQDSPKFSVNSDGHAGHDHTLSDSVVVDDMIWYPLYSKNGQIYVLEAPVREMSTEVSRLIGLLVSQVRPKADKSVPVQGDEEREIQRFSAWIMEQLDQERGDSEIPDDLELKRRLTGEMIPFLLTCESVHTVDVNRSQLKKLLKSYFDGEVVLVPLRSHEWLILAKKELVIGAGEDKEEENSESETDMSSAFCQGLYELTANEWGGTFHLSVGPSFSPVKWLPSMVSLLRETIFLGRTFHVTEHVHFPWELLLERLIYSIPVDQRRLFLEQAGDHGVLFSDNETLSTLETFFQLDCNVSETAKRLYIHRNTLLYRLDKIKQETGLDVRSFGDAVLVKLTMLLYKVTKRK